MVLLYGEHKTITGVRDNWGSEDPPRRETIAATIQRFQSTGNVNPQPRSGRPPSVLDDDGMELVRQSVEDDPEMSVRKRAQTLGLAKSTVGRAIGNLGYRAYRCQLVQELKETDLDKRMEFSVNLLARQSADPLFEDKILWTDECWFGLDESVNTRNCYY